MLRQVRGAPAAQFADLAFDVGAGETTGNDQRADPVGLALQIDSRVVGVPGGKHHTNSSDKEEC